VETAGDIDALSHTPEIIEDRLDMALQKAEHVAQFLSKLGHHRQAIHGLHNFLYATVSSSQVTIAKINWLC
jgi:hypothetical protein